MLIQLVSPMTSEMERILACPKIACKKMMIKMEGMLMAISENRMSASSSQAGATPQIQP